MGFIGNIIDNIQLKMMVSKYKNIFVFNNKQRKKGAVLNIVLISAIALSSFMYVNYMKEKLAMHVESDDTFLESLKDLFKLDFSWPAVANGTYMIKGKFAYPLQNYENVVITAEYGYYDPYGNGQYTKHTGIDLSGIHHDNVICSYDGVVTFAGSQSGYGNCIEIQHNVEGNVLYSFYAHLNNIYVSQGQEVKIGQVIAQEGGAYTDNNPGNSTGHHLHYEVRNISGYGGNINPKPYIY